MEKWICSKCGHEVIEKPESKNTVCEVCHSGRFRHWRLCDCGEWFHPDNSRQRTCSKECGYKIRKSGKKGKHYPNAQKARIATCEVCGKEFRAVNEWHGHPSRYCSKECWSKRATVQVKCPVCGKEIKTYKSANRKYCSAQCRNLAYREVTGEKARAWEGGKTKAAKLRRQSAAYREWRMAVFSRDMFTCQKCGSKTRIEAHHIKEACNYHDLIYSVENGQTLCHSCHKETDNYANKAKKAVLIHDEG